MKKNISIIGFLLLLVQFAWAQSVNVTVQVLPPYSTYIQDYVNSSNKVVINILSYTTANVKLKAVITGDNGIVVSTSDNFRPPTPIALQAGIPKMITGIELRNYLDFNNVTVSGISKTDLFRGTGIPEGNYRLCIQALDYNTGAALSASEPLGCSNNFSIFQVPAPQLVNPICNEVLKPNNIQNVVFSWLPSTGAPAGSQYKLKIVELIPITRNPNEAMNSATTPAFFETTTTAFSFVYGPSQPPLKVGKRYAWRVTLLPPVSGNRTAPTPINAQNKGNSEVCYFEYKGPETNTSSTNISNGITLIKPIKGEKINNGYGLEFSWKSSNKSIKKYQIQFTDRTTQDTKITNWSSLPENMFDMPNSFYASKDTGLSTSFVMPSSFTTGNGKIAWRVVGMDAQDKIIDKSNIEVYEIVDAPLTDRIKLLGPINGKQIQGGENVTYSWTPSKKKTVKEYLVQWAYIKNKNEVSEKLFSNTDFNGSIGPFKETKFTFPSQVDQDDQMMAWRVIGISNNKIVDSSLPDYVEFVKDKSDLANLKALRFNDYTIEVTKINSTNKDAYAGQGRMLLWENGPMVNVWFKDLKVRPIKYIPKNKSYVYAAISGVIDMEANKAFEYKKNFMNLSTDKDSEGVFEIEFTHLTFKANLQGTEGKDDPIFTIKEDLGTNEARIKSKWYTNFFKWQPGSSSTNEQYTFETTGDGAPVKISFKDKIDGKVIYKSQKLENMINGGIEVNFDGISGAAVVIKGLKGKSVLNGKVIVPKANSENGVLKIEAGGSTLTLGKLEIPFKEQSNLNFSYKLNKPLSWKVNNDASVYANVSEMYVHLSEEGVVDEKFKDYPYGLNLDKFGVEVKMPTKPGQEGSTIKLSFDKIFNKGEGYTNNKKGEEVVKSKIDIAGFLTKLQKSTFLIKYNKLYMLNIEGNMYVPFINDWAGINIFIDSKKLQEANLSFNYDKMYYLSKDKTTSAFVKISSGRFENNAIVLSPRITIKNSENKGFETNDMSMCDLYVNADGTVSYNKNFSLNSESTCDGSKKWATYYRFTYGIDQMKIKRNASKNEAVFLFSGDVNLGQNIASNSKKEMGFNYIGQAPNPNVTLSELEGMNNSASQNPNSGNFQAPKGIKGPNDEVYHYVSNLESNISISDDGKGINAGYEDGAQKFGGGFKIVTNDPKWGNYFQLEGKYEAKEPTAKELESKLILGKTLASEGKYTYWFFEFKQKGMVVVPVIPGVVEMHGFGGRAYYHMKPNYNNLGQITDLNPDSSLSLGIGATAYVRTAYDNGKTMHGSVQVVTEFQNWSINGIDYYIKADAVAENSDSPGMLQARLNGELNWVDKYINGKGQVWGKVKDIVCLNEGQADEDSIFFQFGGGEFRIDVGTQAVPISAEIMCGSGLKMGVWFNLDKSHIEIGAAEHYDSGWKGLDLGIASAQGKLITDFGAKLGVVYSPFKAYGEAWFNGSAHGKGCVRWVGCIGGSCSVGAKLSVSMPNPVIFEGVVTCDVSKWIPDFSLHARWSSNGGFSIWV